MLARHGHVAAPLKLRFESGQATSNALISAAFGLRPHLYFGRIEVAQGMGLMKVPSENYDRIVAALVRLGFKTIRQRGSHIRMERSLPDRTVLITVPAHRPVKRSTLSHILKDAEIGLQDFLDAL